MTNQPISMADRPTGVGSMSELAARQLSHLAGSHARASQVTGWMLTRRGIYSKLGLSRGW